VSVLRHRVPTAVTGGRADGATDPALEADLERWHELRAAGEEWADLDHGLKKRLRGVENGVAGHFALSGRWRDGSRLDLPAEVKARYTVPVARQRFTLTIERL